MIIEGVNYEELDAKDPETLTEEEKVAMLGRPRLGDITKIQIRIRESKEFKVTPNGITANVITANVITANVITANVITANVITANVITANVITANVIIRIVKSLFGSFSKFYQMGSWVVQWKREFV
jgi:hypothetical protein